MPACFQLYDKSKPGEGPVVLPRIDEAICLALSVPCDPIKYYNYWFDSIGFRLAIGKTFDQIREEFKGYVAEEKAKDNAGGVEYYETSLKIVDYLDERYSPNSFHSQYKD